MLGRGGVERKKKEKPDEKTRGGEVGKGTTHIHNKKF